MPRVSIVVTNYNYARFVETAVRSALGQSHTDTEVIVIDDGSTDGSPELLSRFDDIKLVLKANGGQTSALNEGFKHCTGSAVIFLDADDLLMPDAAAAVSEVFRGAGISKVHWPAQEIDESGQIRDRLWPPNPLVSGDLRSFVIKHGPYEISPHSANAWSHEFLAQVMPFPEVEHARGYGSAHADAFLSDMAPFFGAVAAIQKPLTQYRLHGSNDFASKSRDERFRRELWFVEERLRRLEAFCLSRGIDVHADRWRASSWTHRIDRAISSLVRVTPVGSTLILLDGHSIPVDLPGRGRMPLVAEAGVDLGQPRDDQQALSELEARRRQGATHLALLWPEFWWRDYYRGLFEHLDVVGQRLIDDELLLVYDLVS